MGINTAIIGAGSQLYGNIGSSGVGFAIPVNMVRAVMEQLIEHGEVRRGRLGISINNLDQDKAEYLGLDNTRGVMVERVLEDSPAEEAGIKPLDVILKVDEERVGNTAELRNRISLTPPGTKVDLLVLRDGKERTFKVKLDRLDPQEVAVADEPTLHKTEKLGIEVQPLTEEIAQSLGYEEEDGVLVSRVRPNSAAFRKGLRRGDLIVEINQNSIKSVKDYGVVLEQIEPGGVALILRLRGTGRGVLSSYIGLKVPEE